MAIVTTTTGSSAKARPSIDVVAHDRAYEAHRLRQSGLDWAEVATTTGYATGRVAAMAVTAYLQKTALEQGPEFRRVALQTELDRLDRLQAAYWGRAVEGEIKAGELVLKIIVARTRLLQLDTLEEPSSSAQRTIVIGGTSEQHIGALQSVVSTAGAEQA